MQITKTTPASYISSLEVDDQQIMLELDRLIRATLPKLKSVLWEGKFWGGHNNQIIGYGHISLTSAAGKSVEWFLVGLTKQKNYFSLYVSASDGKQYLAQKYGKQLGKVKIGSSSISFKDISDLNKEVFTKMLIEAYNLTKEK